MSPSRFTVLLTRVVYVALAVAIGLTACGPSDPPAIPVRYSAVPAFDFNHYNGAAGDYRYIEAFGPGAAFFDYDNDGWLDVYLVNGAAINTPAPNPAPTNRLYRNLQGKSFHSVAAAADSGYGMGAYAADYDNDGDQDLYLTNYGANTFYRNDGGSFTDVTGLTGTGDTRWGTGAAFFDYDNDGDLDLFVANYVDVDLEIIHVCRQGGIRSYCEPTAYEAVDDVLYRNDNGVFADATVETGLDLKGRSLGVALADYDNDGDTDLYVANDGTMNFLYRNEGGTFSEAGLMAGGRYNKDGAAEAGMGTDFGDYDNDGDPDLFVTNFAFETNTLYRLADDRFVDVTARQGLRDPSLLPLGFGARFLDYDNDADLDLFVANGHVMLEVEQSDPTQTYAQADQLFANTDGTFSDVSAQLGSDLTTPGVGRAAASADYDNDGDIDLLITHVAGPARLLQNQGGNINNWLTLALIGRRHKDALGTRIQVTAEGRTQTKQKQMGGSYLSAHDPRLHFGLGQATKADVEIVWADGQVQRLEGVAANQFLTVRQN
jgi:enediyne biosynthesis protein E4